MSDNDSSSSSSDDNFLPPELLERERQLWERNQQLQNKVKHILESTDAALAESSSQEPIKPIEIPKFEISNEDDDDIIPDESILRSKRKQKSESKPTQSTRQTIKPQKSPKKSLLPVPGPARIGNKNAQDKTKKTKLPEQHLIEVEVPQNVEPVIEVKYDPVPELRETLHKIAIEIENVNRQIGEAKSAKTKAEVQVSKLQSDLKKAQLENQNAADDITIMSRQLEESKEQINSSEASN